MSDNIFVDTNILLYSRDASEPRKQAIAAERLAELWKTRAGRISVQVLNEYFVNVTGKLKPGLSPEEAWDDVEALFAWNSLATGKFFGKFFVGGLHNRYLESSRSKQELLARNTRKCCRFGLGGEFNRKFQSFQGLKVFTSAGKSAVLRVTTVS